jgi:flagellar FliJ protein
MAFRFSLATVLRVRSIVEEREERLLQQILYEISQALEALAQTDAAIAASHEARCDALGKSLSAFHLRAFYGDVEELKQTRQQIEGQLEKLEELRDRQLKVYEEARRNREMLTDMHKEKRFAYDSGLVKREQAMLDDNYIARRGRC